MEKKNEENIKALGNKEEKHQGIFPFSPFFGGRIRLLYERLERISFREVRLSAHAL